MDASTGGPTLLVPAHGGRRLGSGSAPPSSWGSHGLPADLVQQAVRRLRVMAILYAIVFFLADFFPSLLGPEDRAMMFGMVVHWLPGALSIAVALAVAAIVTNPRLPVPAFFAISLAFEIASCYGIAVSEFVIPGGLELSRSWNGLSWVSVWMLLFTVVIPSTPVRSLLSGLVAATSVPVAVALSFHLYPPSLVPNNVQFFFMFVFPYLLVVLMAYVGARVLHALGDEVRKARELGSYSLLERIGQGGMGEVWRARHRLLARPAAVKLIRPSAALDVEAARRRFEREAQAIATLRSPHTIELFDFGIADDGTFYYVMELLEGLDTERMVQRFGPLSAERTVHVVKQLCHSLSEAESVGLVHRDIKPANVVICRYGEDYDFVKVLDFGIVKAISEPEATATQPTAELTAEHMVQGTPAFIAPEQALGGGTVDGRADIYAAGCLTYWLLTGQLVFTADTPMRLLLAHAGEIPVAPSTRTEMPIPAGLDALVLACLAKNPDDRPQTARELVGRLNAIALAEPWTQEQARDWWTTHQPIPS